MQTHFTPAQLADPLTARSNRALRACVHCGMCTATCPTYQVLGDELDSPRGRIYLMKDMLETGRPADARTVRHIDRCLGCLSCMTTCPSGVHYAHLLDHARQHIEATYRRPLADRLLRRMLAAILPYPGRFRAALTAAKLARPFRRLIPDARLRAMLDMAPARLPRPGRMDAPQTHPAAGSRRMRVALLPGCAQRALNADINAAAIRALTRAGTEVVIPQGAGCCGALVHHMGMADRSHAQARAAIAAILSAGPVDAVVVTASGCGSTVKDYGAMLPGDAGAARVASLAMDVTEVLAKLPLAFRPVPPLRVGYHAACSLQHGQQVRALPKDLLARAGFTVLEPQDAHLCCGSAGTYNLLQPAIAGQLRTRKVATLEATGPQVIAAGNIGCMVQIGSGTALPVVHTAELIDWATGGPVPPALAAMEMPGSAATAGA